jgi:hypothetical protein
MKEPHQLESNAYRMSISVMILRASALLPAALIALLAGCADTPTTSSTTAAATGSSPSMTATNGPETTLTKGMTAEAVKGIMGEPAEIKPMKSPAAKAEIWVYHRTTRGRVQQVQLGTSDLRQQTEIIEETINLLMFDDKFFEQNHSVSTRLEYQ